MNMLMLPTKPLDSNIDSPLNYQILMDKPPLSARRFNPTTPPHLSLRELIPSSSTKVSGVDFNREIWDETFLMGGRPDEIVVEVDLRELVLEDRLGLK